MHKNHTYSSIKDFECCHTKLYRISQCEKWIRFIEIHFNVNIQFHEPVFTYYWSTQWSCIKINGVKLILTLLSNFIFIVKKIICYAFSLTLILYFIEQHPLHLYFLALSFHRIIGINLASRFHQFFKPWQHVLM
jgi:hypothetical protein